MRGRRAGVLAIISAMAIIVSVPILAGQPVAGVATMGPIPAPPAVGDCVLEPIDSGAGLGRPEGMVYPALRTAPCTGSRYGEVAAVFLNGLIEYPPPSRTPSGDAVAWKNIPLVRACANPTRIYLGLPPGRPLLFGFWSPTAADGQAFIGPSAIQKQGGESWLACVYAPYSIPAVRGGPPYGAAVRGAFKAGTLPVALADCLSSTTQLWTGHGAICLRPHPAESFGFAHVGPHVKQSELNATCRRLVMLLTGMPDPTANGTLRLSAHATYGDLHYNIVDDADPSANGAAYCVVETLGNRQLRGSLLGLRSGPVPWA